MPAKTDSPKPKRDEIVDVASRLIYEQGFGATGIKQIIDEVGIAKGTFYSHFQSKEELGLAWLRARHSLWNRWLEEATSCKGTSAKKIIAAFAFLEQWLEGADYRGCAFINTMAEIPDPENAMRVEVANHKRALHEHFQRLAVDHFVGRGQSKASGRHLGTTIYLLFEGALVEAQNFHEAWPVHAARKQVGRILSATHQG